MKPTAVPFKRDYCVAKFKKKAAYAKYKEELDMKYKFKIIDRKLYVIQLKAMGFPEPLEDKEVEDLTVSEGPYR